MTQPSWYFHSVLFSIMWPVITSIEKPAEKILWIKLEKKRSLAFMCGGHDNECKPYVLYVTAYMRYPRCQNHISKIMLLGKFQRFLYTLGRVTSIWLLFKLSQKESILEF